MQTCTHAHFHTHRRRSAAVEHGGEERVAGLLRLEELAVAVRADKLPALRALGTAQPSRGRRSERASERRQRRRERGDSVSLEVSTGGASQRTVRSTYYANIVNMADICETIAYLAAGSPARSARTRSSAPVVAETCASSEHGKTLQLGVLTSSAHEHTAARAHAPAART